MRLKNHDSFGYQVGVNPKDMEFFNINSKMRNIRVLRDDITLQMDNFSATEKCGFCLKNLSGHVYVSQTGISLTEMDLETEDSHLKGDALLHFNGWGDMKDFVENVKMVAAFEDGSYGSLRDAAFWAPTLWPMEQHVNLSGLFYGPVADMHASNVDISFGEKTRLHLNAYITGLTDIHNTIINADVYDFNTCVEDLRNVVHPSHCRKIVIPKKLNAFSPVSIDSISFIGTIDEFLASARIKTPSGTINADAIMQKNSKKNEYVYIGTLNSKDFGFKNLVPGSWITRSGFDLTIQGAGFNLNDMELSADGTIYNTVFNGQKIDYIEVNSEISEQHIDADINIHDELADLSVSGSADLLQSQNRYTLNADIRNLNLSKLKLLSGGSDSNIVIQSQINASIEGNSVNELTGNVSMSNTYLRNNNDTIHFGNISLLSREMDSYRNISLDCDIMNLTAKGYFNYSDLSNAVHVFCDKYVPIYYNPFANKGLPKYIPENTDFRFDMAVCDTTNTLCRIIHGLNISGNTTLSGSYTDVESLKFQFKCDSLTYNSLRFHDVKIKGREVGEKYDITLKTDEFRFKDASILENLKAEIFAQNSDLSLLANWGNDGDELQMGEINIKMLSNLDGNKVKFLDSKFKANGETWVIDNGSEINYGKDFLVVKDFTANCKNQSLFVDGRRESDSIDFFNVKLSDFDISQLNIILGEIGLNTNGKANGQLILHNRDNTMYCTANMSIDKWNLNGRYMGDAKVRTGWRADKKRLGIQLVSTIDEDSTKHTPIDMRGFYYPEEDGKIEFTANFDGFDLNSVSPYLKSFSSQFEGNLHGKFNISGNLSNPKILGVAFIDNGLIKIDMFNTTYKFADSIQFAENLIKFQQFRITDSKENPAFIDGIVEHNYFKDFKVNISIKSDNLMVINTDARNSSNFYGTLFAKIDGNVSGHINNLQVVANAQTNSGSTFCIPVSDKQQISEQNFIQFRSASAAQNRPTAMQNSNSLHYKIKLNVTATPDVKVYLPMDFSQLSAYVTANGNGNLQLNLASNSDFSMSGDYNINSGSFKLDLMGLFSRELILQNGSSLSWNGNPTDATIDITGVYPQRINLNSLPGADALEQSQHSVNVESIIAFSGNLLSPEIKFDFRMPNADQATEEQISALVDRTNEREMVNQTVSLLAFHQFYSPTTTPVNAGFNAWSSGLGVAMNQVSNVVSNIVDFVDVNVNYKVGDELTTNQLDIDISKEWNRFYFETTFGFGGDAKSMKQLDDGSASTIIGDILVGYKLSPTLHLIAFNRSNTNDYTKQDLPYTQGVGIKYSKEFDTWKNLFARKKKKSKSKKQ